jgi:hypothetical protein
MAAPEAAGGGACGGSTSEADRWLESTPSADGSGTSNASPAPVVGGPTVGNGGAITSGGRALGPVSAPLITTRCR